VSIITDAVGDVRLRFIYAQDRVKITEKQAVEKGVAAALRRHTLVAMIEDVAT
jgi:hypothetical protein